MMILLPLVSVAMQPATEAPPALESSSPRGAQGRLAEMIGEADAVHAITARRTRASLSLDVSLDHDDTAYTVVATVDARGAVTAITIHERGAAFGELGSLSWLSPAIANANAITRITVDEDDAITLTTDAGEAFQIIAGRGSGGAGGSTVGNEATAARWAAAWDSAEVR